MNQIRRTLAAGALLALGWGSLTGCVTTTTSGKQPEMAVLHCGRIIEVEVHNTDKVAHRYTVSIEITHDEMTETELASSESVAPGAKATLTTEILGEGAGARCTILGAQTFPG